MQKTSTKAKTYEKIKCAGCFKSLGIGARIEIYTFLRDNGEATVSKLVNLVKLAQPTVSYHLKEMKELGLLNSRKAGKEVYYAINENCPQRGCDCILTVLQIPHEKHA